jgi:hypothetical protein
MSIDSAETFALLAAISAGKVYFRPDSGDLLYTPRESYRLGDQMNRVFATGMVYRDDANRWQLTKYGANCLAEHAVTTLNLAQAT